MLSAANAGPTVACASGRARGACDGSCVATLRCCVALPWLGVSSVSLSLSFFFSLSLSHPLPSSREGDGSGGRLHCRRAVVVLAPLRAPHDGRVCQGSWETGEWALEPLPQA